MELRLDDLVGLNLFFYPYEIGRKPIMLRSGLGELLLYPPVMRPIDDWNKLIGFLP